MKLINETHNPELESWVTSANGHSDFPIQNLPFAIFRRENTNEGFRGGVAIGDVVLDLQAAWQTGVFEQSLENIFVAASEPSLNRLMGMGQPASSAIRLVLFKALQSDASEAIQLKLHDCLIQQSQIEFDLPCRIGDYTDFYSSINHATRVGKLFRADEPLLPNYKWVPIAYHGRSSTIGVSGQQFCRPVGQRKGDDGVPEFGPSHRLDYELELGIFIGQGTEQGERIDIEQSEQHIFGVCLFNDWSARDIQAWEYQPLGPFLSKSFASTASPWVVTLEALAPYRAKFSRPKGDPQPLPYLASDTNAQQGSLDIEVEAFIQTSSMHDAGEEPARIAGSSFKHSYWTAAQMVTHHSVNGCKMNPGDLLGSGTQSGAELNEAGSLLELTEGGKDVFVLPNGEHRTFVEDGDAIVLRGYCEAENAVRIGFGEVFSKVLPAKALTTRAV